MGFLQGYKKTQTSYGVNDCECSVKKKKVKWCSCRFEKDRAKNFEETRR